MLLNVGTLKKKVENGVFLFKILFIQGVLYIENSIALIVTDLTDDLLTYCELGKLNTYRDSPWNPNHIIFLFRSEGLYL